MAISKKFFVDIDLQGNALKNATIGTNSSISSVESAFGYDSTSHRLQYFDGTNTQDVANLTDISAVTGGLILQGGYDPTTNTPDIAADTTVLKGFFWVATAAGTFLGESVQVGDSIIAKDDNPGSTVANWLILQGNVVVATETVDGIVRLGTQTEVNTGTEAGAVVVTPATLQGKIDAQITPEINNKLPLAGGTMSGNIDMGGVNSITNVDIVNTTTIANLDNNGGFNFNNNTIELGGTIDTITNLAAPTNGGDAANKTYVDTAASTAQANAEATASADATAKADAAQENAEAYADSLAPNYDPAGSAATALANAQDYTDTQISAQSFTGTIEGSGGVTGWTYEATEGYYYAYLNHNLGSKWVVVTTSIQEMIVDFNFQLDSENGVLLRSNIEPVDTVTVSVVKANGNL